MSNVVMPEEGGASGADQEIRAVVKWFNPIMRFGFVALSDGSPDAFLHASVLQKHGTSEVVQGTEMVVKVAPGQRGIQVIDVVEILGMTAMAPTNRPAAPNESETTGTIKWFKDERGYGFIAADDGDRDIFIHINTLRQCGISSVQPGQTLRIRAVKTQKGREATWVELIKAAS